MKKAEFSARRVRCVFSASEGENSFSVDVAIDDRVRRAWRSTDASVASRFRGGSVVVSASSMQETLFDLNRSAPFSCKIAGAVDLPVEDDSGFASAHGWLVDYRVESACPDYRFSVVVRREDASEFAVSMNG